MDPLRQQQLTMSTVEVFLSIEEEILLNVAKRLKSHNDLLTERGIHSWQALQLGQLDSLTQQNVIAIAKKSGLSIDEVSKMLEKAGYEAVQENEEDLQEAVRKGALIRAPSIASSTALAAVITAYQAQARDKFNMINTTMLGQSRQLYLDIINQTTGKVLAGSSTPREALRETAARWAEKGVPALVDKAGRQWSTEAYVSMVTRSMSNNVANDMQFARMDEYDVDLVLVSAHAGARPRCAPYQGKIYSRGGLHPRYSPLSFTSYGEAAGLRGVNCKHIFYPYIEGITQKTYQPYPAQENQRIYEESQQQRYLERRIRAAKRELSMMEAMGDDAGIQAAKKKIRERQADMRDFINDTERTRRREREQIY